MSPVDMPLGLKPAPLMMLTLDMVTVEFPALVSVTFCVLLLDTFTLPKPKAVVLALRSAVVVAGLTVSVAVLLVALPALLLTVTLNVWPLVSAGVV